jgi:hypothetical protein
LKSWGSFEGFFCFLLQDWGKSLKLEKGFRTNFQKKRKKEKKRVRFVKLARDWAFS